ncbi:ATP-binding protein [Bacteroides sp. ET336]|uniref:ATP-binding protein n=1 Tax=Bacteroides sp. ET336 TaxID=2972459 RepID=UPI0021AC50F9|nr:ATP-binding protein [Bacteroides sp. ET336]MCR8892626.1 ATP-binding protein [Bacteroides sp. ET336]MDN0057122.1 ATP-binding protein [Bacteroides caecigallinarum]
MNRLYPIGIQNFEKLRKGGFVYVDKTALIHRLVSTGGYYFFGRPRRFGKSLMISTLESYFEGRKDLFQGLAIESLEKDWDEYPIFHIDLNNEEYNSRKRLEGVLNNYLVRWERIYGSEPSEESLSLRFAGLIRRASEQTGRGVVILIDEYDKPLIQSLDNEELQSEYRSILKSFYGNLKSCDKYIRFALLTGVTRFSRVSIFSDLNNLRDITMENEFASLCGISETELITYFESDIRELSVNMNLSYEETCGLLQKKYDGYHFTGNSEGMYNPFSVLNTFASMKIENYWFSTGTPTILVKLLQKNNYLLSDLTGNAEATADELTGLETINTNPIPLFFQSGYLTIKEYDPEFKNYILGFPNEEVEQGFLNFLMPCYMNMNGKNASFHIMNFIKDIRAGKIDSFMERLQSLFSDTPYELIRDTELHYQNVLFIVFRLMGFFTHAEYHTSQGRIDMVVKTPQYIYVMEFKFEGSAEDAIAQIESRNYALPFMSDGRKVYKIGVNFSGETRNIDRWIVAE